MEDPHPNQIQNYPQVGELKYLFRKDLTYCDMSLGLLLTKKKTNYFNALPELIQNQFENESLMVKLYTPMGAISSVAIKRFKQKNSTYYKVMRQDWNGIAQVNGFSIHVQVDCWCVYNPQADEGEQLSLLIQKVTTHMIAIFNFMQYIILLILLINVTNINYVWLCFCFAFCVYR